MLGHLLVLIFALQVNAEECLKPGVTYGFEYELTIFLDVYDAYVCRDYCMSDSDCNAFTFYNGAGNPYPWACILFRSDKLQLECEGCQSGTNADCTCGSSSLECVRDEESDNFLGGLPSSSELECKSLCQEFQDCEFYTWLDDSNVPVGNACFLYSACKEVSACTGCSTGPKECEAKCTDEYMIMDDPTRNVDYHDPYTKYCDTDSSSYTSPDWSTAGWYRMMQPAGTQLPEVSPGYQHCGTHGPGWLNSTSHSPILGNQVEGKVCFDWDSNICNWSTMIDIRSCGGYYIYNLPAVPDCVLRYCSV